MAEGSSKRRLGSMEESMQLLFGGQLIYALCKDDYDGSEGENRIFLEIFSRNDAYNTSKRFTSSKTTVCCPYSKEGSDLHVDEKSEYLCNSGIKKPIHRPGYGGQKSDNLKMMRSVSPKQKRCVDQDTRQMPCQIVESSSQGIISCYYDHICHEKANSLCYTDDILASKTNHGKKLLGCGLRHGNNKANLPSAYEESHVTKVPALPCAFKNVQGVHGIRGELVHENHHEPAPLSAAADDAREKCSLVDLPPASEESHVTTVLALPCVFENVHGVHGIQEELVHENHHKLTPLSAAIDDASKTFSLMDLHLCLRTHAHNLLVDVGFQSETRPRKGRSKLDSYYRHEGGPIIRSLSRAWKECGKKLFADSIDYSPENYKREWVDVDMFWHDLTDVLAYIEEKVSSRESSLTAVKCWQLLDPFVTVVCIDQKITPLKKGWGIKVVGGATFVFKVSSAQKAKQRNESLKSIALRHSTEQVGSSSHFTVAATESSSENFSRKKKGGEISPDSHHSMPVYDTKSLKKKLIFGQKFCRQKLKSLARSIGKGYFLMRLHQIKRKASIAWLKPEAMSYSKICYSYSGGIFTKTLLPLGCSRIHFRPILQTQKCNSICLSDSSSVCTVQQGDMIMNNKEDSTTIEDGPLEEMATPRQKMEDAFSKKRKSHEKVETCDSTLFVNMKKFHKRDDETGLKGFLHNKNVKDEYHVPDKMSNFLYSNSACLELKGLSSAVKRKAAGISCQTGRFEENVDAHSAISRSLKQHKSGDLSGIDLKGRIHWQPEKYLEIKASKAGGKKTKAKLSRKNSKEDSYHVVNDRISYFNTTRRGMMSEHARLLEANEEKDDTSSTSSGQHDDEVVVSEVCPRFNTKYVGKSKRYSASLDRKSKRHLFKDVEPVSSSKSLAGSEKDQAPIKTEKNECSTELVATKVANSPSFANGRRASQIQKNTMQKENGKKWPRVRINDDDLLISAVIKSKDFCSTGKLSADGTQCPTSNGLRNSKSQKDSSRLLLRISGKSGKLSMNGKRSLTGARTVLAWLIDSGVLPLNDPIQYLNLKKNIVVKDGWATRDGIICKCCTKTYSVSEFKVHAGSQLSKPSLNLFLASGKPYSLCQFQAWSAEYKSRKCGNQVVKVEEIDQNDDTCGLCGDGGELLCCDNCPSTFHQDCLLARELPEGSWYCRSCTCNICGDGIYVEKPSKFVALLKCMQCQNKYHKACIMAQNEVGEESETDSWFCSGSCRQVYLGFHSGVGILNSIADGFSWEILKCSHGDLKVHSIAKIARMAECNIKLAIALSIMEECFLPMVDTRTGIHIIPHIIYNWGSNYPRLNYEDFYTIILEKGDEVISVAAIRVHGVKIAEIPLVATCDRHRRQGMCRRLMTAIEGLLKSLNVELLVLSAIPSLVDTWKLGFGFETIGEEEKQQLNNFNLTLLPGTLLLKKCL